MKVYLGFLAFGLVFLFLINSGSYALESNEIPVSINNPSTKFLLTKNDVRQDWKIGNIIEPEMPDAYKEYNAYTNLQQKFLISSTKNNNTISGGIQLLEFPNKQDSQSFFDVSFKKNNLNFDLKPTINDENAYCAFVVLEGKSKESSFLQCVKENRVLRIMVEQIGKEIVDESGDILHSGNVPEKFANMILYRFNDSDEQIKSEETEHNIPAWIQNNAKWWSEGSIGDSDFVTGIQFLINQGIMKIPATAQGIGTGTDEIPDWIKNNAGWWADGLISNEDFISGLKFLVESQIIRV